MKPRFERIVLIGFKGSGKTRVGKLLAAATGYEFLDIDAVIENIHAESCAKKEGVRAIFKRYGADYFRELEGRAIAVVSKAQNAIVSLGGGTPMNKMFDTRNFGNAAFVHLDVRPDALFERITRKGFPPFFDKDNPRKSFDDLYEEREPFYKKIAMFTVDNSYMPPEEACKNVCAVLGVETTAAK